MIQKFFLNLQRQNKIIHFSKVGATLKIPLKVMNTQLKKKFANRFARFNRETQGIVLELVDGSEAQVEKIDGEYVLSLSDSKQYEGFDNIFKVVNMLIDNGKVINLGIADFE